MLIQYGSIFTKDMNYKMNLNHDWKLFKKNGNKRRRISVSTTMILYAKHLQNSLVWISSAAVIV